MPKPAASSRDILAEVMSDGRKTMVPVLAEMMKREAIAEVPADEERRRFWQRALTDEQEAALWQQEMAQRGLTPEMASNPETAEQYIAQMTDAGLKIASQVYPDRFDMMTGEGRNTQAQQAQWAWKHAQHGPPKPKEGEQDVTQAPVVQQADQGWATATEQDRQPVVPQGVGQPAGVQAPAVG